MSTLDIFFHVVEQNPAIEALPLPSHPFGPSDAPQFTAAVRLAVCPEYAFWLQGKSGNRNTRGLCIFPQLPAGLHNSFHCVCACCGTEHSSRKELRASRAYFEEIGSICKEWGIKTLFSRAGNLVTDRLFNGKPLAIQWGEVTEFQKRMHRCGKWDAHMRIYTESDSYPC